MDTLPFDLICEIMCWTNGAVESWEMVDFKYIQAKEALEAVEAVAHTMVPTINLKRTNKSFYKAFKIEYQKYMTERMLSRTSGKYGWDHFDPRRRSDTTTTTLVSTWEWVPCTCKLVYANDPVCFNRTHARGESGLVAKKSTLYNQ